MARYMIAIYPDKVAANLARAALPSSHRNARVSGPYEAVMVDDETKTPTTGHYLAHGTNLWVLQSEVE
ncbi:MAG: hypothetical protein DHS20C17_32380 [Cyclobacteriaceae bacterium]|nr:MAG: hypothetical protein DHS20C17_32380 [Cyclobacteriaceae bacterium]